MIHHQPLIIDRLKTSMALGLPILKLLQSGFNFTCQNGPSRSEKFTCPRSWIYPSCQPSWSQASQDLGYLIMDRDTDAAVEELPRSSPSVLTAGIVKPRRKPRAVKKDKLSSDQVRRNHVVSEQRRRELVRNIYDDLVQIVPDLEPSERRSEILIYLKTMNHLKWLYQRNSYLRKLLAEKHNSQGTPVIELPNQLVWELSSTTSAEDEGEIRKINDWNS